MSAASIDAGAVRAALAAWNCIAAAVAAHFPNASPEERYQATSAAMTRAVMQCPHGYDECWSGCVYPGRCGRFTA